MTETPLLHAPAGNARLRWFPTRNELDMRAELLFAVKIVESSCSCTCCIRPNLCFVESSSFKHIQISCFVAVALISVAILRPKPCISSTSTPYISHSTRRLSLVRVGSVKL